MELTKKNFLQRSFSRRVGFSTILIFCLVLILFSIGFSLTMGQADISVPEVYQILFYKIFGVSLGDLTHVSNASANIIWYVRTPRVLLAVFVGMGLALSGAIMQAVVQNPLADPYILGVSSGASLGATFAILIGFGVNSVFAQFGLTAMAFLGAIVATMAVLFLASIGGSPTSTKLILSGTIISALCSSAANFIIYLSNNAEGVKSVTFWSMGSLASAKWGDLPLISFLVVVISLFFLFQHRPLNVMLLGDEAAMNLGISLTAIRRIYMLLAALLTGIIVAYSGMIGFVGLIVPHIIRGIVGSDHRRLLPLTALAGALFLIWADMLARTLISNAELPIGIITSAIGAPVFIYIIIRRGYHFGG